MFIPRGKSRTRRWPALEPLFYAQIGGLAVATFITSLLGTNTLVNTLPPCRCGWLFTVEMPPAGAVDCLSLPRLLNMDRP